MTERGPPTDVLRWTAKVLSADDLRRHLNGHREIWFDGKTIITPLALDELRARGVRLTHGTKAAEVSGTKTLATWGYAQEQHDPLVSAAIQATQRDGLSLVALTGKVCTAHPTTPVGCAVHTAAWARGVAEQVSRDKLTGAVAVCIDAALVCCIANKVVGIRAAVASNGMQTTRALTSLGANLLAVEMPGRTLFELRQILKIAAGSKPSCPDLVAKLFSEVEGHAHR